MGFRAGGTSTAWYCLVLLQDTDAYCHDTLCAPELVAYVNQHFLCWGGDLRRSDAFRCARPQRLKPSSACAAAARRMRPALHTASRRWRRAPPGDRRRLFWRVAAGARPFLLCIHKLRRCAADLAPPPPAAAASAMQAGLQPACGGLPLRRAAGLLGAQVGASSAWHGMAQHGAAWRSTA